jgi:ABC-type dipeptide/oligopeptide/nickel transport system permease component
VLLLVQAVLREADLSRITLNVLLRDVDPFRALSLETALLVAIGRSAVLLTVSLGAALALGTLAAVGYSFSRSRGLRAVAWAVGTVGVSLPSFLWAMLLVLVVVLVYARTQTRILPTSGFGLDEHIVLPALALAARPAAYVFRVSATALEEISHLDYVRTARAKGLLESLVLRRHVLPNAAPTLLAGAALALQAALSSLAIVEYVFSWHGAGYAFIHAVANRNPTLAGAIAVVFAVAFALIGLATRAAARRSA